MPENEPHTHSSDAPDGSRSDSASSTERGAKEQASHQNAADADWTMEMDVEMNLENVKIDLWQALVGGALAAVVSLAGAWLVGQASGAEAHALLNTSLPSTRSFCGTVTLALGNILALMLTLLSLSASSEVDLKQSHYVRVKQIALVVSIALIGSILIYLLLNVPLSQSDTASEPAGPGYATLYYATLALSSLLAGALITVVLMLYNTVRDIIRVIGPKEFGHHLTRSES